MLSTFDEHAVPIKIAAQRGMKTNTFPIHACPEIACSQYTVHSKGITILHAGLLLVSLDEQTLDLFHPCHIKLCLKVT